MSNCLLIILVIGSWVTSGGFPSTFSKCCFHMCIWSCWLVTFSLALAVLFLLFTSLIVCHAIQDCLSLTGSLIFSIWFFYVFYVWKTRKFDDILLQHCNAVYIQNPINRWMKGCIVPFPKKSDLGLAKNYRGITLTSTAAKINNALQRNCIEPKIDNILRKNQNGSQKNRSTTSQIFTIRRILESVRAKNI